MATITLKVKGLTELQGALRKWPSIATKHTQEAITRSIFEVQREAVPKTPVDTGRLRRSYRTKFGLLKGELWPSAEYAFYVHEGTRYMRGRPYLKQGVDAAKNKIEKNFRDALKKTTKEVAKKAKYF